MQPLQKVFPRLDGWAFDYVCEILNNNENPLSCEVCDEDIFSDNCNKCSFKNRRVKDLLIESHIPLVKHIVKTICDPRDYDEIISVGLLALTRAVDKLPTLYVDSNISAYFRVFVTREIKQFILTNTVIKVPAYAHKKYNFLRRTREGGDHPTQVFSSELQVDLDDVLEKIPDTVNDSIVMGCLIKGGYSGKEMAELCHVTTARISQLKQQLVKKIYQQLVEN